MGITVIHKSERSECKSTAKQSSSSKIALVLAGGMISGAAFKIGGLKALNDFLVNRKLTEFDTYVGLSAGAILAIPLAGGISPEEMLASLDGKSKQYAQLSPFDLYTPNLLEYVTRPLNFLWGHITYFPAVLANLVRAAPQIKQENFLENAVIFLKNPTYSNYENLTRPILKTIYSAHSLPSLGELLPSGMFDIKPLELYLRENMRHNKMPNNFRVLKRATGKSLYMTAMNLDTSENVVFGPDEKYDVKISEAAQASSAVPLFYKPARIKGVDYIDGGVRKTANIDLAYEKGADLVICYNPFRPYNNKIVVESIQNGKHFFSKSKHLADWGVGTVINQVFRTLFHSRLQVALTNLKNDPEFKKDLILIEPTEDDNDFFTMNPMFFWNRGKAARLGFDSVSASIIRHYDSVSKVLAAHGITISKEPIETERALFKKARYDDDAVMGVLENPQAKNRKRLRAIKGGKAVNS